MAERFNRQYGVEAFVLPDPRIDDKVKTIVGLDGRKMSKSYGNTIPLWLEPKPLQKRINQIVTNSQSPEEPKDPDQSAVFALHRLLCNESEEAELRGRYRAGGLGWGQAKKDFCSDLEARLTGPREEYRKWMANPEALDTVLKRGAEKARAVAMPFMETIRKAAGIR
jgi:tryptophanyl-tRNA synthetase